MMRARCFSPAARSPEATSRPHGPVLRLQRKCARGGRESLVGECDTCLAEKSLGLQPKLVIGDSDDSYEREADRVADRVMSARPARPDGGSIGLQHLTTNGGGHGSAPAIIENVLQSPGRQLDPTARAFLEPRFGHDFSQVRVHADAKAVESAAAVNAHAYTVGRHIVFGDRKHAPATADGRRLLAHELTHVIQQSRNESSAHQLAIGRIPNHSIQRDDAAAKARETAKSAHLAELQKIESNWQQIRDSAAGFGDVAGWLSKGDTVVGLLRTHTELTLAAIDSGDFAISDFMKSIMKSDIVMYRFISWHVVVFVNLLSLEPQLKDLERSFAADDRAFTGRDQAEEIVQLLTQLAAVYRKQAPKLLQDAKFLPAEVTGTSGRKITLTVTIAAHTDPTVSELFTTETDKFVQDQAALETLNSTTNQFLDRAFKEGLLQAAQAVVEFYSVRGSKREGPNVTRKKGGEKKGEKKRGRWGCTDVRCNVYPDPQADPPNPSCPKRVIGNTAYIYPGAYFACLAAEKDANSKVPRGCVKRHCNCRTKCSQK